MTFVVQLCLLLLVGSFLAKQCAEGFKDRTFREQTRLKRGFGNLFGSKPNGLRYTVDVKTSNQKMAGTDANVFLVIKGSKSTSPKLKLSNFLENNFERGNTDKFKLTLPDLGEIRKITVGHDNFGVLPDWNLDNVRITAPDGKQYKFVCNCDIKKGSLSKDLVLEGPNARPAQALGGCSGVFADASHCWPFNNETSSESPDLKGGFPAKLKDGARIADSVTRGKVASTLEKGSWIDLGNFKGKCISDPSLCVNGITMMFWAKIDISDMASNDQSVPKLVFSSGGSDVRSRGFSFFLQNNMYVLQVVTAAQKWNVSISYSKMPFKVWFSIAFTWDKARGLTHYINGKADGQPVQKPSNIAPHDDQFNDLEISKPNSNNKIEEMVPVKFDQFVTWGRILPSDKITQAFNEGGGVSNKGKALNVQACQPNPCLNGGTCKIDDDDPKGYRCVCALKYAGLNCGIKEEEPVIAASTAAPTTAAPTTSAASSAATTSLPASTKSPTTAATTAPPSTVGSSTAATGPTTVTAVPTSRGPTTAAPTSREPTTAPPSTGGPSSAATGPTTVTAAPTSGGPTTAIPTTGGSTIVTGSTATATTAVPTTAGGSTIGPTSGPTSGGTTIGTVTPSVSPTATSKPGPEPDTKQLVRDLIAEINKFRRLHQSSDLTLSEELNNVASQWAQKIANEGIEKIDPNSTYGQLVCSHNAGGNIAKACAVKWYGAVKFFDWADPKLTIKASPFTQMVWKNNSAVGVGIAKGGGKPSAFKRQNVGGKEYIVVLFDPGQNDEGNIKANVLPATGISEPALEATCPKGYSKLPQGSRSCFSVKNTPLTWDDALYGCALDNGTLASLQCKEEADLVVNLLTKSNISEAWIGLHDHSVEGRYVWVDGSTIPFSEWLQEEPNGGKSENCIVQAKANNMPGWADRRCFETKAFVCEVPVPGYSTYKLTFNLTEPKSQSYRNNVYSQSWYPGSYSMCTPYVRTGNDLLRETITRYFQAKNIIVQPIVNTIQCLPNGLSIVEVLLRLGPEAGSDSINSLQTSIKENDGELELSNGASARLVSVEIVPPGVSPCPSHCASTFCQPGCDQSCCTQSSTQYQSPMTYQQPFGYHQAPSYTNRRLGPMRCPYACVNNANFCPPYCSTTCCRRRSRVRIHKF